jgi:hypothetical protein
MKVRVLWVAWGAVTVMAVVVLVAAFWANRANDPPPAPAQVHHDPRALPVVAVPDAAAVPARMHSFPPIVPPTSGGPVATYRLVVPPRHTPLPRIGVAGGPVTPVASGP